MKLKFWLIFSLLINCEGRFAEIKSSRSHTSLSAKDQNRKRKPAENQGKFVIKTDKPFIQIESKKELAIEWTELNGADSYYLALTTNTFCKLPFDYNYEGITATRQTIAKLPENVYRICLYAMLDDKSIEAENSGLPLVVGDIPKDFDLTPPSVPTGLEIADDAPDGPEANVGDDSENIFFRWKPSRDKESGISGYKVVYFENSKCENLGLVAGIVKDLTYELSKLVDDTSYTFQVYAQNGSGISSAASACSAGIHIAIPNLTIETILPTASGSTCAMLKNNEVKCWGMPDQVNSTTIASDLKVVGDDPGEIRALRALDFGRPTDGAKLFVNSHYSVSGAHACLLFKDGSAKCWGSNHAGELGVANSISVGIGTEKLSTQPVVNLGNNRTIKTLSLGYAFTCAILGDDTVKCWGANTNGQLGQDSRGYDPLSLPALPPINMGGHDKAKMIAAGAAHVCVITSDDKVKCWGDNSRGAAGAPTTFTNQYIGDQPGEMANVKPIDFGIGAIPIKIAVGYAHSCALLSDNSIMCWGSNVNGECGYAGKGTCAGQVPLKLAASHSIVDLKATAFNTCILMSDHGVKCFGLSHYGILGQDSRLPHNITVAGDLESIPSVKLGDFQAKDISVSYFHACIRTLDDKGVCWGTNFKGSLGTGNPESIGLGLPLTQGPPTSLPVAVKSSIGRNSYDLGVAMGCAILNDETLRCWGNNNRKNFGNEFDSQLGHIGDTADEMQALKAAEYGSPLPPKMVTVGEGHTCILLSDGSARCWGQNVYGQLGIEKTETAYGVDLNQLRSLPAVKLPVDRKILKIAAKANRTCALFEGGAVRCWGDNTSGQLGLGMKTPFQIGDDPGEMVNLTDINLGGDKAKDIVLSKNHSCVILEDNRLKCWGNNSYGELGIGNNLYMGDDPNDMSTLPTVPVSTDGKVLAVAVTQVHTCAITINEQLKCWGRGGPMLNSLDYTVNIGDDRDELLTAAPFNFNGKKVKDVAMSGNSICALLDDTSLRCWGSVDGNYYGDMGQNTLSGPFYLTEVSPGVQVAKALNFGGMRYAKSIKGFDYNYCAIMDNNTLRCWGKNFSAELGIGSLNDVGSSTFMSNLKSVEF